MVSKQTCLDMLAWVRKISTFLLIKKKRVTKEKFPNNEEMIYTSMQQVHRSLSRGSAHPMVIIDTRCCFCYSAVTPPHARWQRSFFSAEKKVKLDKRQHMSQNIYCAPKQESSWFPVCMGSLRVLQDSSLSPKSWMRSQLIILTCP